MNKGLLVAVYVVIAAGVIGWGSWYANKISEDSSRQAAQAGQEAQDAQAKIMQNLKITDIVVGTGAEATNGSVVSVNYTGSLDDGTVFDSSYKRNQPFSFPLGMSQVIKGWDLGVLGMKVGGKRELTIPPELGYGARGAGAAIPPNATLHFTVELLAVSSTPSAR